MMDGLVYGVTLVARVEVREEVCYVDVLHLIIMFVTIQEVYVDFL